MIRSIEFDLETRSPNAVRFASKFGQMAEARRIEQQRNAVRRELDAHFGAHVPTAFVLRDGLALPNRIVVRFTRIAAGALDPEENLPMAFKGVKDEIAAWCGYPNDRHPIFTWAVPYGQERAAPHVQRVRIEIEDLAPGEPRRIVLAERASEGRAAAARVKRAVQAATKAPEGPVTRSGSVLSYQPAQAAAGASSAARGRAEAAFAKLTGKPTATDLRDAAEQVLSRPQSASAPDEVGGGPLARHGGSGPGNCQRSTRDPGEERPARDLAACETCGARAGAPCTRIGQERFIFGVHERRARAAGLTVPPDDRAGGRAARVGSVEAATKTGSPRKLATVPGQARLAGRRVYVVLPWRPGYTRDLRLEGLDIAREIVDYSVPVEHRAAWGASTRLHRREGVVPGVGVCWIYEGTKK